jgi:anaphase-promoting complex subunit 3
MLGEALHAFNTFACHNALETLRELPARHQASSFVQSLVARCHFDMADYRRAVDVYSDHGIGAGRHQRPIGLEFHSTALWHLRRSVELGHLAQRALEWDRRQPQVWVVVGNCFSLQQEHDKAVRCFKRAIQLDPSFVYAYTLIAHENAVVEKFDQAINMYEHAISLDPWHYNAWWGLGNVYNRQEDYPKAKHHFQRAVEINGSNAILRASLGMALKALGKLENALGLFTAASRSNDCGALASMHEGAVLMSLGRHCEAVEKLRRALGLAPREPSVHYQLGRAHAGAGDKQRAMLHYTFALDLCGSRDSKEYQAVLAAQAELLASGGAEVEGQHGRISPNGPGAATADLAVDLNALSP